MAAFDFDRTPLADVFRSLADRGGINVVPDWADLADDAVQPPIGADTPVTLHLRGARWSTAMDAVLLALDPRRRTAWTQHGDLVAVGLARSANAGPLVTRVYDVRPLVDQVLRQRSRNGTAAPPTLPDNCFQSNQQQQQTASPPDDESTLDEIKALVQRAVDPDSRKDNGGDVGSIASWGDELVVCQTEQNQRRVAAHLQLLLDRR